MAMGTLEETEPEVSLMCKEDKGTAGYSMAEVGEPLTPSRRRKPSDQRFRY